MVIILVVLLAAIEVVLVALVIRTLWRWGAPETAVTRTREPLASPATSAGGAIARSPGRVGPQYVAR
ncbi:MAG: hypothetical protein WC709_04940 [Thermoleophilia bacterium]